jgi:DnaK suppressor protein
LEKNKLNEIRGILEEERAGVEKQLAEHGAAIDGDSVELSVNEGFADSAAATTERSELLSLVEELQSRRNEIAAALERIENGTYGRCERCGQEIPVERLEAIPTARLCVSCKQLLSQTA